jgi:hypothetical protein
MAQKTGITFSAVAEDVVVIAVMGVSCTSIITRKVLEEVLTNIAQQMTGSGKSTFIHKLTGSEEAVVGDSLASCKPHSGPN